MPKTSLHSVQKGFKAETQTERMLAYNVDDPQGNRIGDVSGIWVDAENNIEFVGAKTTWLTGKTHIFPAESMEVNHAQKIIRAPYSMEVVKNAPTFDPDAELDETQQQEIFAYYARYGLRPSRGEEAERRGEVRIPLAEEQLKVGKRQVEAGGMRLRKVVRTQPVQQEVELKREEVTIERVPAGERTPSESSFQAEDIFIPLRREEAVVQKEAHVREEVRVGKRTATERQTVSEELRKEELETSGTRSAEEKAPSASKERQRGT